MGVNKMAALKTRALLVLTSLAILAAFSHSAFGAAASISKSVTPMADGNYLVKLKVTSSGTDIYGIRLIDPGASIVNVYAPRGWCAVTDGGDYLARTSGAPLRAGKPVEFIIHSTSDRVDYTWSAYGWLKHIGKPERI